MNLFPLNKGLMWKEWRQNRWAFWLGLVILSFPGILYTLLRMYDSYAHPMAPEYQAMAWREVSDIGYNVLLGHIPFFPYAALGAAGLGGFLLSQERTWANTLDFLVATPVSRREIISAKFVTGLKMIGIVWVVNLAFVLLMALLFHSQFSGWLVIKFFGAHAVFLLAIYSAGFLVAAFCGNILSTAIGLVALNVGPYLIGNTLLDFTQRYVVHDFSSGNGMYYQTFARVMDALSLFHYATLEVDRIDSIQVVCLLAVALVFYLLTLYVFERNAMERNGRLLMFGDFWKLAQLFVPLVFALIFAFEQGGPVDMLQSVITFVITFVVLYVLIKIVRRVMRSFGFR
jgi:ABC-type transport system involved in multi-copper enzyme maturation permease subunit